MIYRRKPTEVDAFQFLGNDKHFELDGVQLIRPKNLTGYASKLAHIVDHKGDLITVRPNDYVYVLDGHVRTMSKHEFEDKYELASRVDNNKKSSKPLEKDL